MARYPTFEEYDKKGTHAEGVKRCDDLLERKPNDVQLLTVKLRLQAATQQDVAPTLDQLLALQPPIQATQTISVIEEAVVNSQRDDYPRPRSAGAQLTKIYDQAMKAARSMEQKLDLQSLRFSTAIYDDRLVDAQQALIQLKALQPGNRVLYMAHAAVTYMLSTSKEDLQSRLALSLARKAVTERFDLDPGLDCRVAGQILAVRGSIDEVRALQGSLKDSKQVFEVLNDRKLGTINGSEECMVAPKSGKLSSADKLAGELASLKQTFKLMFKTAAEPASLIPFAVGASQTFHTATKSLGKGREGRITVDICFLAVSALVRAFQLSHQTSHLLQATYLVECLLRHDKNIHEARLILVYLYMRLGLGSCAVRMFESLSVKEIQHDTVGHCLLTELSYTQPFGATLSPHGQFDPITRLSIALTVYSRCENRLAETEASVLENGQTGMILDVHELRNKLRCSFTRRLMLLEQRRCIRLTQNNNGGDLSKLGAQVVANWLDFSDNRDFNAAFDFDYNVEKLLHGYGNHLPGKQWLLFGLVVDTAWCLAQGTSPPVNDVENLLQESILIETDINRIQITDDRNESLEMPPFYYLAADLARQVLRFLHESASTSAKTDDLVEAISQAIQRLNVDGLIQSTNVFSNSIRAHYAYLDVLRLVVRACQALISRSASASPLTMTTLQQTREIAEKDFATLQRYAKECAKQCTEDSVRTTMESAAPANETFSHLDIFGPTNLRDFRRSVAQSAKEGWEGVGRIQLV